MDKENEEFYANKDELEAKNNVMALYVMFFTQFRIMIMFRGNITKQFMSKIVLICEGICKVTSVALKGKTSLYGQL
jgi:hypothetical protein